MDEVRDSLPYLSSQYPNSPFVLYLKAAVNSNGEEAIEQYKTIVIDYPNSVASELSIMKIGEYLYSIGLYSQAIQHLKIIPLYCPESNNIERAVNLMKKSYLASGEKDSIDHYIEIFSKKYPQLNFNDYDYYSTIILKQEKPKTEIVSQEEKPKTEEILKETVEVVEPTITLEKKKLGEKPWVIQVGAFRDKKNAEAIVNRLESAGYIVEVIENSSALKLFLVQIVRFSTIEKAINVGEKVSDQFGLEFRILKRN
jgi:tetratricopeptide (TPR) repeat protein